MGPRLAITMRASNSERYTSERVDTLQPKSQLTGELKSRGVANFQMMEVKARA